MFRVELLELANFFAMIIPARTGVVWVGNAGGISQYSPELEGFLVPLDATMVPHPDLVLHDFWYVRDMMSDPREIIERWLAQSAYLTAFFEPDPTQRYDSCEFGEAWVPVKIHDYVNLDSTFATVVAPFRGRRATLVYTNSA